MNTTTPTSDLIGLARETASSSRDLLGLAARAIKDGPDSAAAARFRRDLPRGLELLGMLGAWSGAPVAPPDPTPEPQPDPPPPILPADEPKESIGNFDRPAKMDPSGPIWRGFCAKLGEIGIDPDGLSAWRETLGKPRCSALSADQLEALPALFAPGRPLRARYDAWLGERTKGTCESCRSPIVWGRTAKGKPVPLDPDKVSIIEAAKGPVQILDATGRHHRGEEAGDTAEEVVVGHVSHFATCPHATGHRKPKAGSAA